MKKAAVILLASTFFVGGAYAQSPDRAADPAGSEAAQHAPKSAAERHADVERHIVDLHANLKITPAEESLWVAVVQTMRDNASNIDTALDKREDTDGTAIDDLNAYANLVQAHADGVKKLSAVFTPLYASMSGEQKKVADDVFAQRMHGEKNPQALK